MPIIKGEELNYANKYLNIIIQGSPGVGKSTLAQSAPNVLTFDFDNGMCRVKPQHRKDTSICSTFDEVKADVAAAKIVLSFVFILEHFTPLLTFSD